MFSSQKINKIYSEYIILWKFSHETLLSDEKNYIFNNIFLLL